MISSINGKNFFLSVYTFMQLLAHHSYSKTQLNSYILSSNRLHSDECRQHHGTVPQTTSSWYAIISRRKINEQHVQKQFLTSTQICNKTKGDNVFRTPTTFLYRLHITISLTLATQLTILIER